MSLSTEIPPGSLISQRYRIEKVLGQGGFGRTYLVYDTENADHPCVLKELLATQTGFPEKSTELFAREAQVLAKLKHPQIPEFLGCFEENNRVFIVQEFIEGTTYQQLRIERHQQGKPFSEAEIIQWLADILPVLDYIHSQGVIHRDIAPDNIMLPHNEGKPILIDFGVVKQVVTELGSHVSGATQVSKHGYSAPEQVMGRCYPSSDLYALASTILYLLTGQIPSQLFDTFSMSWQWQEIGVGENLEKILGKMLAHSPSERYQSAQEVLNSLSTTAATKVIAGISPFETELSTDNNNPQKKKRKTLILGAIASVCLLGVGAITLSSPYIPRLCKTLDNCAKDKEFQSLYEQENDKGKTAISKAEEARNIQELEQEHNNINNVISQLKTIPDDVKIYQESQDSIQTYQTKLTELDNQLQQEKQAQEKLKQIQGKITETNQQKEAAKTIAEHQQIKTALATIKTELNAIPQATFVSHQVSNYLTEIAAEKKAIDSKINAIIAEENRRKAEVAAASAERRRKAEEQAAAAAARTNQPTTTPRSSPSSRQQQTSPPARTSNANTRKNTGSSTPRNTGSSSPSSTSPAPSRKEPLW